MDCYAVPAYSTNASPRFVVVWDLHWNVIESHQLEPTQDLPDAMAAAVARLAGDGWHANGSTLSSLVYFYRGNERRLLMFTPKDPDRTAHEAFIPFTEMARMAPVHEHREARGDSILQ